MHTPALNAFFFQKDASGFALFLISDAVSIISSLWYGEKCIGIHSFLDSRCAREGERYKQALQTSISALLPDIQGFLQLRIKTESRMIRIIPEQMDYVGDP